MARTKDELAIEKYLKPYGFLCKNRKRVVDTLYEVEKSNEHKT